MRVGRVLAPAVATAVSLAAPALATAAATPLGLGSCARNHGVYRCSGLASAWDGVPLDTTVTLPRAGVRHLPLVVELNGFGNSKYEYLDPNSQSYTGNAFDCARRGYAVLTYTARGFWGSCGTPPARLATPSGCATGYIRPADIRHAGRDARFLVGALVDQCIAGPAPRGVPGASYAGGR